MNKWRLGALIPMWAILIFCFNAKAFAETYVKTVAVRGEGEVKVRPDKADVYLQVRTKAKDAKSAQAQNAKEMARVQKVLKADFKIDSKNIQTASFTVNPEYRYQNNGKQIFLGYAVEHGLTVNVSELKDLGSMLDSVIGKGTENTSVLLQNISFGSTKRSEQEIQAMEIAMKNADLRATALARFAKRSLKGVLRVSDSEINFQPPHPVVAGKVAALEMNEAQRTEVSAGEIVIRSTVSVEYLLE